jgi:hypothetical protein
MNGEEIEFREQYLMGALSRQGLILEDISKLLAANSPHNMTSVFILFRCLLDDYLTILYLSDSQFSEESFIRHTAQAHSKGLSMLTESRKINERFFGGLNPDLASAATEQEDRDEFRNDPANSIYYTNATKMAMKSFCTTSSIVGSLTVNAENTTAAHSFVVWKMLSHYVHYSHLTYDIIKAEGVREIEVNQLQEILYYCLRSVVLIHFALRTVFGFGIVINDETNIADEITKVSMTLNSRLILMVKVLYKKPIFWFRQDVRMLAHSYERPLISWRKRPRNSALKVPDKSPYRREI